MTEVVDEKGHKTQYQYGENSHLVSRVIHPDGTNLRYGYDNVKNFVSDITNERGEAYHIDYFPNGLVSQENTFDGRSLAYTYDLNGKLLSKIETGTNGTELETIFERDSLGRLLVKTLPDGSKIEYQYDKKGNLISVDDGDTPLAWRYDIMDRVIESHAGWSSHYYEYDELGLLSKWQLPDANVLEYQRAKGGVLRAINLNDAVLTQHHFQKGLEVMRNQGEVKSHFHYDDQGRLVNQSQMLEGREKQRRQYQYDGLGNLVQISDKQRGDTFYDYDPLSRLTAVRGNLDEQFTHDATGNLIPNHISLQSSELFEHAPGNQLKINGDSHYEYDEFGRLIKESRGRQQSLVTHYEYDCQHRLIKVTMPDGSQAHYRYDAFGRRIEKRVTDKTGVETITEFLWQGDNLIAEMTNSEQYQSYVYEPGTFRPLALLKGEGKDAEVYHYHLDQIGTPLDITTPQGETVWSVQYRAYGNVFRKIVAEIDSPLRFQGQYFDAETGLHYNRHRYYNPNAGRFITIDPIGLAGGLNNYQYVPNPTGWVDPLGLHNIPGKGACKDPSEEQAPEPKVDEVENPESDVSTPKISKNAETLRTGGNNTVINVRTKSEADKLLKEAFPDYQKVNGVGHNDPAGIRKKRKMDRFKQGGAYHKDYAIDPSTGTVKGHAPNNDHGKYPHINIKRRDGVKVLINIVGKK
ncbi:RHS repeat-associated core domain-containing protein [Marinomonas sp.]|uniref:RHS repeat-associated core domain-containing protein n=1 Tax=Marinomonas sp. TaxID=1904862 RepID=UPI003BABC92C